MKETVEPLFSPEQIAARIAEMGQEISKDYAGRPLLLVGVLKGSFIFLADLMRKIEGDVLIDFLRVSSYGGNTETSGVVELRQDVEARVAGRDVVVVEDIIDTGLTLAFLRTHLAALKPASLKFCVLLDKTGRRRVEMEADYVGFVIDDVYVVGYGFDRNDHFRHLPGIGVLRQTEE